MAMDDGGAGMDRSRYALGWRLWRGGCEWSGEINVVFAAEDEGLGFVFRALFRVGKRGCFSQRPRGRRILSALFKIDYGPSRGGSEAFIYAFQRVHKAQGTGNGKFMRCMSSVSRR
jgi:hypothetical protein